MRPEAGMTADWVSRAEASLALAKVVAKGVVIEDLCYQAQQAAEKAGIKPIIGTEIVILHSPLEHHPLVFLAASNAGYATLCRLLTRADESLCAE